MHHNFAYYPYAAAYYPYVLFAIAMAIAIEVVLIRRSQRSAFSWQESLASLAIAIGHRVANSIFVAIPIGAYDIAWQNRLLTIPMDRWWSIPLLFVGIEFFYYWHHRAAHEIRWLWATHAVHHSARHLNLSAAYRLGWTGWLSGNFLFFMPLSWLGFNPVAIAIGLGLNLTYQFWIHTELIPKLGWLEWSFNTPSHHRVHHASNPEYIDRNYGGVLIIFDRLFGTFRAERPNCRPIYGLTHPLPSYNPFTIAFYEWSRLFQDLMTAKTWRDCCWALLGRPTQSAINSWDDRLRGR